jgi:hypothetical protein
MQDAVGAVPRSFGLLTKDSQVNEVGAESDEDDDSSVEDRNSEGNDTLGRSAGALSVVNNGSELGARAHRKNSVGTIDDSTTGSFGFSHELGLQHCVVTNRVRILGKIENTLHFIKHKIVPESTGFSECRLKGLVKKAMKTYRHRKEELLQGRRAQKHLLPETGQVALWKNSIEGVKRNSLVFQLRLLVYHPDSSPWATLYSWLNTIMILASIVTLYVGSLPWFQPTGESSSFCEQVISVYCSDKTAPNLDPGCFQQGGQGPGALKFFCEDSDCFGHGRNFGAPSAVVGCHRAVPFQSQAELKDTQGQSFFQSWEEIQFSTTPCSRVECALNDDYWGGDGNSVWLPVEIIVTVVMTTDLVLKLVVAYMRRISKRHFFTSIATLVDILSVLPLYILLIVTVAPHGELAPATLDFTVMSSLPISVWAHLANFLRVTR